MRNSGRAAKMWRDQTGGSCRYAFSVGGARMEFSAPETTSLLALADVLEETVAVLRAFEK